MSDHDTWNMFFAHVAGGLCAHPEIGSNDYHIIAAIAAKQANALLAESKKRETPEPTPPQPDDGWTQHNGYGPPDAVRTGLTAIELEGGNTLPAVMVNWQMRFRYRIVSEAGVTK